jgi:SAM-dependent methyltransferase
MAVEAPIAAALDLEVAAPVRRQRRAYLDLFLISFVILFFELTCIRWFGSMVIFLTFFTNIVLLACFLGMTVGCLAAKRTWDFINTVIPLALVSVLLSGAALLAYFTLGRIMVDVGGQGSPQQVYFGTEYHARDPAWFVIPIEVVAGLFFVLIALMFVGLGQVMGRLFNAIPDRVSAYTVNILGSLVGIAAFGLASYFRTPPIVWFGLSLAICLYFVNRWTPLQVFSLIALLVGIGFLAYGEGAVSRLVTVWSPYYKVYYNAKTGNLIANNIAHQGMGPIGEQGPGYFLPYLMCRDAGAAPFEDVLVIGAGSGNDVQAALASGARHVDAVEIDPVINEIGRRDHPNHPYDDPRVTVHLDDGRSFVRKTDKTYDLVVYAVVDSLVLHSGYSSLRLESFLFTEQAFRDIKAKLKPGGVFTVMNTFRQGWVAGRLAELAEKVFGAKPVVVSSPYVSRIEAGVPQPGGVMLLIGEPGSRILAEVRKKFEDQGFFWINGRPLDNGPINGYSHESPHLLAAKKEWIQFGMSTVHTAGIGPLPTDDWPFLYLREASIPNLNLRAMAMIGGLSLAILLLFAPVRTVRPNGQMFFLGAAFMLLESKSVVHMALLFGSTWVVNSVVFFAILVMILLSNLFVLSFRPRRLWPCYALLIAALLVNIYVPMSQFLALPGSIKVVASCAVVFLPIFFAGVIFAAAFRDSRHPDVDFGSNIGGVILGGLSENLSLMVGFNHMLVLAIAYYMLSAILRPRAGLARSPVVAG